MADTRAEMRTLLRDLVGDTASTADPALTDAVVDVFLDDAHRFIYDQTNRGVRFVPSSDLSAGLPSGASVFTLAVTTEAVLGQDVAEILAVLYSTIGDVEAETDALDSLDYVSDNEMDDILRSETINDSLPHLYYSHNLLNSVKGDGLHTWRIRFGPVGNADDRYFALRVKLRPRVWPLATDYPDVEPEYRNQIAYVGAIQAAPLAGRPELADRLMNVLDPRLAEAIDRTRRKQFAPEYPSKRV